MDPGVAWERAGKGRSSRPRTSRAAGMYSALSLSLVGMGLSYLLTIEKKWIQGVQPQIHGAVQTLTISSGAEIKHEAAEAGQDDGGESAGLLAPVAFPMKLIGHELKPILNGGTQKSFVSLRMT